MDKMKDFFNNLALDWDNHSIDDPKKLERIFKTAELCENNILKGKMVCFDIKPFSLSIYNINLFFLYL